MISPAGLHALPPLAKVAVVIGGYAAAFLFAVGVVSLHVTLTPASDPDASSGLRAFGDLLVFILVFCPLALVPTWLALSFIWGARKR